MLERIDTAPNISLHLPRAATTYNPVVSRHLTTTVSRVRGRSHDWLIERLGPGCGVQTVFPFPSVLPRSRNSCPRRRRSSGRRPFERCLPRRLANKAASFEARSSVSTWLLAIARYKALSARRQQPHTILKSWSLRQTRSGSILMTSASNRSVEWSEPEPSIRAPGSFRAPLPTETDRGLPLSAEPGRPRA